MGDPKDISKQQVPLTWAQFILIVFFAISSTFTVTKIYDRFELLETTHETFESLMIEKFIEVEHLIEENDIGQRLRLDTKTKRNADEIEKLKEEIK